MNINDSEGNTKLKVEQELSKKTKKRCGEMSCKNDMGNVDTCFRYRIVGAVIFGIIFLTLGIPCLKGEDSYAYIVSGGTLLTIIIICLTFIKDSFFYCANKKIYRIIFTIIGGSFLLNGIIFSVLAYIVTGIIFAIIIPIFHRTIYSCNSEIACTVISKGVIVSFGVFLVISLLCGPALGEKQYMSFFENPNILGGYMIIVVSVSIFMIIKIYSNRDKGFWLYFICLCLAVTLAIYSNSRTSMIAIFAQIIVVSIVYLLYKIKCGDGASIVKFVKYAVIALVAVVVMIVMMFFVLTDIKIGIIKTLPEIQIDKAYDKITAEQYFNRMFNGYTKGIEEVASNEDKNDAFTSGRKEIWKQFYEHTGILGHKDEGRKIVEETRYYAKTNAHNVYLQMAYSAGIITGLAMLCLMIFVAKDLILKICCYIKSGCIESEAILTMCTSLGFAVFSLTSGGYMIYTYLPTTMFYFMLYTVTVKDK